MPSMSTEIIGTIETFFKVDSFVEHTAKIKASKEMDFRESAAYLHLKV